MQFSSVSPEKTFQNYHAFWFFKFSSVLGKNSSLPLANFFVALSFLILFIIGAMLDGSLLMEGKDIGLFEHPAIFAFLLAHMIFPYYVFKGIKIFSGISNVSRTVINESYIDNNVSKYFKDFSKRIKRETPISRTIYLILISFGFIAFAWNSYQNQAPYNFLGFDFWDSINNIYGYILTRFYKLYLWCFFFPAISHILIMMLVTVSYLLKDAKHKNQLKIEPFHEDGCGGVKAFIDTLQIPLIPLLIIASITALSAIVVHGELDLTPLIGIIISGLAFLVFYFIPAVKLREVIVEEKARRLKELSRQQNLLLDGCLKRDIATEGLRTQINVINSLSSIKEKVQSVPNWPQLASTLKLMSALLGSPIVIWILKSGILFLINIVKTNYA